MQDDEGREVAIKIDRMDSKFSANPDSATKAYMEVHFIIIGSQIGLSTLTLASHSLCQAG